MKKFSLLTLTSEIKKNIFNKNAVNLHEKMVENREVDKGIYTDYLYYYQQATRWK